MATRGVIGYYLSNGHTTSKHQNHTSAKHRRSFLAEEHLSAKSPWKGVYVHNGIPVVLGKVLYNELMNSDANVKSLIDSNKCGFSFFPTRPYHKENCDYFTNKSINSTIKIENKHTGQVTEISELATEITELAGIEWLYLFDMHEKKLNIFMVLLTTKVTQTKEKYMPKIIFIKSVSYSQKQDVDWLGMSKY